MEKIPVKIVLGNERTTVVEKKNYSNSIFEEQYRHALHQVVNYLKNDFSDVSQIVAFCGDRGEGKTSCLLSYTHLLKNLNVNGDYMKSVLENESDCELLAQERMLILPMLDPSYFEKEYNILEYFTGVIYNYINLEIEDTNTPQFRKVLKSLQTVKKSLYNMHKRMDERYDPLDEIGGLALGLNLKELLQMLVRDVLRLTNKSRMVVSVDDIDLNMEGAYMMVEQIRKYLCMKECLIFVSVNLKQLQTAISVSIQKNDLINSDSASERMADEMARKYIDKLIPASARINMPGTDSICQRPLIIEDKNEKVIYTNNLVKNGVVELIFQKTRYLFFNTKGGVSRIVPNNLRELMHLIGLLSDLPEIGAHRENLRTNQKEFKSYFFKIWTQKLPFEVNKFIDEWINSAIDNVLNKNVVDFISSYEAFETYLKKDFSDFSEDQGINPSSHLKSILFENNFSYNISVGDVFYVINCLEKDYISERADMILFFIKSFYSMRLYEDYDAITEIKGNVYPLDNDTRGIYRSDDRFLNTNMLQRLVNGGYFTYTPGDLLAYNLNADLPIDKRVILGLRYSGGEDNKLIGLNRLIHDIIKDWNRYPLMSEEEQNQFDVSLKIAEFFMLTVSRSISSKTKRDLKKRGYIEKYECQSRANVMPTAYARFTQATGYYLFDVLAPFANLINPEYTYKRFSGGDKIFEIACSHKDSLLYALIKYARVGRGEKMEAVDKSIEEELKRIKNEEKTSSEIFYRLARQLFSDAILRNAEILAAFFEDCKIRRDKLSRGMSAASDGYPRVLAEFYSSLIYQNDRAMSTHRRNKGLDGEPHHIKFGFLQAFVELLKPLQKNTENIFNEIYNPTLGIEPIERQIRLLYLLSVLSDKSVDYSSAKVASLVSSKYPEMKGVMNNFKMLTGTRTKKKPLDWYRYFMDNYKNIDEIIDNSSFDKIYSSMSDGILNMAVEQLLSPIQVTNEDEDENVMSEEEAEN